MMTKRTAADIGDIAAQVLCRMDDKAETIEAAFEAVTGQPAKGADFARVRAALGAR